MFVMNSFSRFLKWLKGTKPSRSVSAFSTSHHLSIKPGQILGSRFTIVKQLGAGQHSTVWLATSDNGPKAIKILTSDVTSLQGKDAFELEVLERISTAQSTLTNKRLLQLQDHFRITGEHVDHGISLPLVKHVTRQLLEGLQVLHDQCHTVHTDVKPDNNILFSKATMWGDVNVNPTTFDSVDIMLVDFGTAMPHDAPHTRLIQPVALRCPEVITGCVWNCKADIWNLGCIVFELITGQHLFKPKADPAWSAEQYHLARIFATFGTSDVPQNILNFFRQGQHFEKYFNNEGLKITAQSEPLDAILHAYNVYTPELNTFLSAMLQILPDDRLSAKSLLASDWLQFHHD